MSDVLLSIVVPVYNEEQGILHTYQQIDAVVSEMGISYEILFVDDGSTDQSFQRLTEIVQSDPRVRVVRLSRNFGHQAALTAGMDLCRGEAMICMDADLQHPPALIPEMVQKWQEGFEVVYTIRHDVDDIGLFKQSTSRLFYRLINWISPIYIQPDAADFRLVSRKVIDVFKRDLRERNRFLRGMTTWVGFHHTSLHYQAQPRFAGSSKYSLVKMVRFALSGLTSFSNMPLYLGLFAGIALGGFSVVYGIYALVLQVLTDRPIPGWTSLLVMVSFIGAIQLFILGLLGLYIGYMFDEIKGRPIYIVDQLIESKQA
jgi:glycosyltransferase involved in cell wall biosynthesis